MKLFTPTQTKTLYTNKQAEDIEKIAYLTKTLNGLQRQINDANENFKKLLTNQREVYSSEKEKLQDELKKLNADLTILRRERKKLLKPIGEYRAETEKALLEATERAQSVESRENELTYSIEKLQAKLDDVGQREMDIQERAKKLRIREEATEKEAKMVSDGHVRLNEMMAKFQKELNEKTQVLKERENAMIIVEQRNKEYLAKREKELADTQRKLDDQRGVLDRLYKEIKRLQK